MIDPPHFDHSPSLVERIYLGGAALGAAALTVSVAILIFF
jgi:hypothetical protein